MYVRNLVAALMLVSVSMSTPVDLIDSAGRTTSKRQIAGLGDILKGIMDQGKGGGGAPTTIAPTVTTPAANNDCADALQKIDDALDMSARYMKVSGNKPSITDIQAVLAVLADSLDDDCKENDDRKRDPTVLAARNSRCSECERQLYNMVKGLQEILSMTQDGAGEDQVSNATASTTSFTKPVVGIPSPTFRV